jgi:hypothetical protein
MNVLSWATSSLTNLVDFKQVPLPCCLLLFSLLLRAFNSQIPPLRGCCGSCSCDCASRVQPGSAGAIDVIVVKQVRVCVRARTHCSVDPFGHLALNDKSALACVAAAEWNAVVHSVPREVPQGAESGCKRKGVYCAVFAFEGCLHAYFVLLVVVWSRSE